jgi:hypothetical protein
MEIKLMAKNRVKLLHRGKELRIEVNDREDGFRLYFAPGSTLKMPRELVVGRRKMVIV